jgi:hypothetical protein
MLTNSTVEHKKNEFMRKEETEEIQTIYFEKEQAELLHYLSDEIAFIDGPQSKGAKSLASLGASKLKKTFSNVQNSIINNYVDGKISGLIFENMREFTVENDNLNEELSLEEHEKSYDILYLGGRNQILLKLINEEAFAYDIDNEGKLIRVVANFKGGGLNKISNESESVELSSHTGITLGPHTEAPYNCTFKSKDGFSPSPSSLILSAKCNPRQEPTLIIPISPILKKIGIEYTLALTSNHFYFTRSDSFIDNKNEYEQKKVSIIDFDEEQGYSIRYNSYRFSIDENAPSLVKEAYILFCDEVNAAEPIQYSLTRNSAIVINNYRALHCRNIIEDNRRLLVRLFGISNKTEPTIISNNPLIVKG